MPKKPKISVIMPAYNAERTIAGSINSILSQSYENWELIIVNDGSTDKTEEVCRRFNDRRIKFFNRSHSGIPSTRNFGNSKARGTYCIVQDADDFSMPNRLEKVILAFQKTDADIVIHGLYLNSWDAQYQCLRRIYKSAQGNVFENTINGVPAYKKSVWKAKPFREETKYSYDWMMHLDWKLSGFEYYYLEEGLYEYVRYQGSASDRFERSGQRAESFKNIKEIVEKVYGRKMV